MSKALELEKNATNKTYTTDEYGPLPALSCMLDMGWQKRAAGRSYNSPSGVLHAVGGHSGKIISSFIYRNRCNLCAKLDRLVNERSKMNEIESTDNENLKEITLNIEELEKHTCLKIFDGPSKSMETDAIVQLILCAPKKLKAYVRTICMDDDTITRSHIQEDVGPKSKGCLPYYLVNIKVVAGPSHRKRTVLKWYYSLAAKRVSECALTTDQAKKLTRNFGYFQKQIKEMTLHDVELAREAAMLHLVRTHKK